MLLSRRSQVAMFPLVDIWTYNSKRIRSLTRWRISAMLMSKWPTKTTTPFSIEVLMWALLAVHLKIPTLKQAICVRPENTTPLLKVFTTIMVGHNQSKLVLRVACRHLSITRYLMIGSRIKPLSHKEIVASYLMSEARRRVKPTSSLLKKISPGLKSSQCMTEKE